MSDKPTCSNRRLDDQVTPADRDPQPPPPVAPPPPPPTNNNNDEEEEEEEEGGGLLWGIAFALERSISTFFYPERAVARERLRAQQREQQQLSNNGSSISIHRSRAGVLSSSSKDESGGAATAQHRELRPSSSFRTVASSEDDDDDDSEQRSYGSNVVEWTLNGPNDDKNLADAGGAAVVPLYFPPLRMAGDEVAAAAAADPPAADKDEKQRRRRGRCWFALAFLVLVLSGAGALAYLLLSRQGPQQPQQQSSTAGRSGDDGAGEQVTVEERTDERAQAGGPTTAEEQTTTIAPNAAPVTAAPVTAAPTTRPTPSPTSYRPKVVKFAALGDVPYTDEQSDILWEQMKEIDSDLDFVIHVGDLRRGDECRRSDYEDVAETFRQCEDVPVFVIKGDNDAWDCANYEQGLEYWADTFVGFTRRHWDLPFAIERMPGVPENFAFEYKGVLFIGVDVPGGDFDRSSRWWAEWESHLDLQVVWVLDLLRSYDLRMGRWTGRVVLFGHANPNEAHKAFFDPLTRFMEETGDRIPVLYVNGDGHEWSYDPGFYDTKSLMRIMVRGEGAEPPVIIRVLASGDPLPVDLAFDYDRQL